VAAAFTLVIERKPKHSIVGAMSMPVAALLLMLAVFLGNEIRTLQPILDSYWRPIHVGIAAVGYGVCLVSFGLAILYLIRDGVRMSALAAWVAGFGVFTYLFIDRGAVLLGSYSASALVGVDAIPLLGGGSLRVHVPGAGPALLAAFLSVLAAFATLVYGEFSNRDDLRKFGMKLVLASIVVQTIAVSFVAWRVSTLDDVAVRAAAAKPETLVLMGASLAKNSGIDPATLPKERLSAAAVQVVEANSDRMRTAVRSNPIEFSAMISVIVMMLVVSVLAIRPERVLESMPSLKTLDGLQYLTVSIAFPLLSLLLITGAVWANESWGRYWGWDNKEVGALVTWLAYAGYLHTRIAHGWTGRRSAYVAILGFALVIFTYLGVSYLLPGLHSYAG
jgi:ABC-type transport system involved in cytochrome c biogenesis permease subunit